MPFACTARPGIQVVKPALTFLFLLYGFLLLATERDLGATGSSGRWVKVARIQNQNPVSHGECSQFSGTLNIQTDFGQTGYAQYFAVFSFGVRGGIKPLLIEHGNAQGRSADDQSRVEWRVYESPDGWKYLWFWQSNYSRYAVFDYQVACGVEMWTYEAPPADYVQLWSSLDGPRQTSSASFGSVNLAGELRFNSGLIKTSVSHGSEDPALISALAEHSVGGYLPIISLGFSQGISSGTDMDTKIWSYARNSTESRNFIAIGRNRVDISAQKIYTNGVMGIGTSDVGNHELAVEGSIGAREVKVEARGWSDFVFAEDYTLPDLDAVKAYITEHKHLPGIPSEAEVSANGINLGEMDARLLQKIEELTLYVIDLKEKNEELKSRMDRLENENVHP